MKTISLKNVKNGLSRDEMRSIKGGCIGHCSTKRCTLYTGSGTWSGSCGGYSSSNMTTCWCQTGYGHYIPSGGLSACWN